MDDVKEYYMLLWKRNGETEGSHGIFETENDAIKSIYAWWDLNDFKPFYVRMWEDTSGDLKVDYGLHNCFYVIKKVSKATDIGDDYIMSKNTSKEKLDTKWIEFLIDENINYDSPYMKMEEIKK